jgi:hypothetical protein
MHIYAKYAASVVALLAAMSLAQAQSEHQGAEKSGGAAEHAQPERAKEGATKEHAPAAKERGKDASTSKEKQPVAREPKTDRAQSEPVTKGKRTAKAGANESEHDATGRANIHISGAQRIKLHDVIGHDTSMHRYHASDFHFAVEVGSRIPDDITFYDAPVQFIDVDPEFRGYKIVVLDDEILVIDPETREIVDVIPT